MGEQRRLHLAATIAIAQVSLGASRDPFVSGTFGLAMAGVFVASRGEDSTSPRYIFGLQIGPVLGFRRN